MPLPQIDWRISEQEKDSAATLGKLIVQEFARIGFPVPRLAEWAANGRYDEVDFINMAHPTGATRMAGDYGTELSTQTVRSTAWTGFHIGELSVPDGRTRQSDTDNRRALNPFG